MSSTLIWVPSGGRAASAFFTSWGAPAAYETIFFLHHACLINIMHFDCQNIRNIQNIADSKSRDLHLECQPFNDSLKASFKKKTSRKKIQTELQMQRASFLGFCPQNRESNAHKFCCFVLWIQLGVLCFHDNILHFNFLTGCGATDLFNRRPLVYNKRQPSCYATNTSCYILSHVPRPMSCLTSINYCYEHVDLLVNIKQVQIPAIRCVSHLLSVSVSDGSTTDGPTDGLTFGRTDQPSRSLV